MSTQTYTAAGCIFTDGNVVLAGYQPRKKPAILTGLGGKREALELPQETAWREVLEELFEWAETPLHLVATLCTLSPKKIIERGDYIQYVYSFDHLQHMLEIVAEEWPSFSPVYTSPPRTLHDLLLKRKKADVEVTTLCLLPVQGQEVAGHFKKDLFLITN